MNRLGFFSVLAIIALRMCIGWHFYKEGTEKIRSGKFSASGFLGGATGPLEDYYHDIVWDGDGMFRLDAGRTGEAWQANIDAMERKYGFSADQKKLSEQVLSQHQKQLAFVLDENAAAIEEYRLGSSRIDKMRDDPTRNEVASLRGQRDTIKSEWRSKSTGPLKQINQVWDNFEQALNGLLSPEQHRRGPFAVNRPRLGFLDTSVVDKLIPYFDVTVGVCLLLGLFARPAALAAGLFLISVVLSQFPGWPGSQPTYYQAIEALACLFLAAVGAGRFGGLDLILAGFWARRRGKIA